MDGLMRAAGLLAVLALGLSGCGGDKGTDIGDCGQGVNAHAPEVTVISPNGGESLFGTVMVKWLATDPDSGQTASLTVSILYSPDDGKTWTAVASDESNDGAYDWDVAGLSERDLYLVRVKASDGDGLCASDESDLNFAIQHSIVIVDQTGKSWDITHAERTYGMLRQNWGYGLGPNAIRPIVNPRFYSPGDDNYPEASDGLEIIGVTIDGDARAYSTWQLSKHEVVNDIVGGRHVAVTY